MAAYIRAAVALAAIPAAFVLARFMPRAAARAPPSLSGRWRCSSPCEVFEPELFLYFLTPALALFPISASRLPLVAAGRGRCVLAFWLTYWFHVAIRAEWSLWLILLAQLALLAGSPFPGGPRTGGDTETGAGRTLDGKERDGVLVKR